jgi:hypothetical protein
LWILCNVVFSTFCNEVLLSVINCLIHFRLTRIHLLRTLCNTVRIIIIIDINYIIIDLNKIEINLIKKKSAFPETGKNID